MAAGFGLLAALFWGLSDFLISVSGRFLGVRSAMLFTQLTGVLLAGSWLLIASIAKSERGGQRCGDT